MPSIGREQALLRLLSSAEPPVLEWRHSSVEKGDEDGTSPVHQSRDCGARAGNSGCRGHWRPGRGMRTITALHQVEDGR
jgi:hypothetical protein